MISYKNLNFSEETLEQWELWGLRYSYHLTKSGRRPVWLSLVESFSESSLDSWHQKRAFVKNVDASLDLLSIQNFCSRYPGIWTVNKLPVDFALAGNKWHTQIRIIWGEFKEEAILKGVGSSEWAPRLRDVGHGEGGVLETGVARLDGEDHQTGHPWDSPDGGSQENKYTRLSWLLTSNLPSELPRGERHTCQNPGCGAG